MRKMKLYLAILCCVFVLAPLSAQTDVSELMKNFSTSDWKVVKPAKIGLENLEDDAIPELLILLEKNEIVKVTNTGSLIYPGADKFFGYGQIVDYDIDNLAIRAGWALEDISFMNFGFSGYHLPDEELLPFIKITFPNYYNNASNRKKLEASTAIELRNVVYKLSVKKAKDWWEAKQNTWSRVEAIVDALKSFDEKRQVKALFYMRNGTTKCSGLNQEYYFQNLAAEVVRLSASETQRVSEHARFILLDNKLMWLESKNVE